MPRYTHQAGAQWPNSLIDLTNYQDAQNNSAGEILAQIKAYQEAGDYDAAQQLIHNYSQLIKPYVYDSAAINKYVEELRNLEIYTKSKKQQIFYEPTEDEAANYVVLQDVWIGNVGDASSVIGEGSALDYQVLEGTTFIGSDGQLHEGTMRDYGAVTIELMSGQTYTIPAGYHNGGGFVKAISSEDYGGGTVATLPTFTVNGWKDGFDITGYNSVQFRVAVPTVATDTINVEAKVKTEVDVGQEIKQFVCITGWDKVNGTKAVYSSWFKDVKGDWQKKTSSSSYGIRDVSGSKFTITSEKSTSYTYWAW